MSMSAISVAGLAPAEAADRFSLRLAEFRDEHDTLLASFLEARRSAVGPSGGQGLGELLDALRALALQGGKRLRPALVVFAHDACRGKLPEAARLLSLAVELLHTYLLVHDDIMDHAELRRGQPTAHVVFRRLHESRQLRGSAEGFGNSVAILVGDLAYALSVELFGQALAAAAAAGVEASSPSLPRLQRAFSAMCQEVIGGQYLELSIAHRPVPEGPVGEEVERELLEVLRLKSGRYTAERPLELGALLAGAPPEVSEALARYGAAVGEAFQLQDDLLGVFGDAGRVGKPVGGDLVEGKFTFLIYHALRRATPARRTILTGVLGSPEATAAEIERACAVLEETGARRAVEEMVEARLATARQALGRVADRLDPEGGAALSDLIEHLRGREA